MAPAAPLNEKLTQRMAQLQQEVTALQARLAHNQTGSTSAPNADATPAAPPPAEQQSATIPDALHRTVPASAAPAAAFAAPPAPAGNAVRADVPPAQQHVIPAAPLPPPPAALMAPPKAPPAAQTTSAPRGIQTPSAESVVRVPERREAGGKPRPQGRRATSDANIAPPDSAAPASPRATSPTRMAAARPVPPPVLPPPRPSTDDSQSVLARLRQGGPQPQPLELPRPAENRPPVASPALPRLSAARSALASGRADDAVRLLQEAQLQLVFRPIDTPGADPAATGQGASDVARALEALSANNVPASMRYIDHAMADLNGVKTASPTAYSGSGSTGYAPAYPPR
ncbi:MAG TPA: hypothetical protein VHO91_19890 [Rhodopila sp.]|nr:hypothetical protein [Rhodopila sp.]